MNTLDAYITHLLGYIDLQVLTPLKVVVNAGNGCAGPVLDALEAHLPFRFVKICHEPDPDLSPRGAQPSAAGKSPRSRPQAVREHGAAVGLAWDGDFDRCFFFDEQGDFIEGYYLVGLYRPGAPGRIIPAPPSSTTPGSPGTPSRWCKRPAAAR